MFKLNMLFHFLFATVYTARHNKYDKINIRN